MSQQDRPTGENRLCLFAHYHPLRLVGDHVLIYLKALRDAGFRTIVSSTSPISDEDRQRMLQYCEQVHERDNIGTDLGSWADAWRRHEGPEPDLVLLTNDSVYGPLGDLGAFIETLLSHPADFYGAVKNIDSAPHLQSWFVLLRPTAFNARAFRGRMENPPSAAMTKWQIIDHYEVGLTQDLVAEGLSYHAAYDPDSAGQIARSFPMCSTLVIWKCLVEIFGIPFMKVELLRNNPNELGDLVGWKRFVEHYNKELADAIERDVATRFQPRNDALLARMYRSIQSPFPSFWPELNHFLRRDAKLSPAGVPSAINKALFTVTKTIATPVRRLLMRLKDRRGYRSVEPR